MKNKNYFEGWYFKHQKGDMMVCFIVGRSSDKAFIQIITNEYSKVVYYHTQEYNFNEKLMQIRVGNSVFSLKGCILNMNAKDLSIHGKIKYNNITPICSDIMGPFRFLPKMECRHGVYSLDHNLTGSLNINSVECDFSSGRGYIEGDAGTSFPDGYFWCQCNDFETKTSIMIAVASIPYIRMHFTGIICCVYFRGKEYRLATYKGAKIIEVRKDKVTITQGKLRLEAYLSEGSEFPLLAPIRGQMARTIHEAVGVTAHFKMFNGGTPLFDIKSSSGCREYVSIDNIKLE